MQLYETLLLLNIIYQLHCSTMSLYTYTFYSVNVPFNLLHCHCLHFSHFTLFTLIYTALASLQLELTYIIIQYTLNNALPFNQPRGALNYKNIRRYCLHIYGGPPNVMQCYLKMLVSYKLKTSYSTNVYTYRSLPTGTVHGATAHSTHIIKVNHTKQNTIYQK